MKKINKKKTIDKNSSIWYNRFVDEKNKQEKKTIDKNSSM